MTRAMGQSQVLKTNDMLISIDFKSKVTLETMVVMTMAGLMMAEDLTEVTNGQAS